MKSPRDSNDDDLMKLEKEVKELKKLNNSLKRELRKTEGTLAYFAQYFFRSRKKV
jgi:septal ring factor EnvC (AmiA/AmiB activator)